MLKFRSLLAYKYKICDLILKVTLRQVHVRIVHFLPLKLYISCICKIVVGSSFIKEVESARGFAMHIFYRTASKYM